MMLLGATPAWMDRCLVCGHQAAERFDVCPVCALPNRHSSALAHTLPPPQLPPPQPERRS